MANGESGQRQHGQGQVSFGPRCGAGIQHEQQIKSACDDIVEIKETNKEQWEAIEKLKNRLPIWATLFISFLTGVIGILIGLLIAHGKTGNIV